MKLLIQIIIVAVAAVIMFSVSDFSGKDPLGLPTGMAHFSCYDTDGGGSEEIHKRGTVYYAWYSWTDRCSSVNSRWVVEFGCNPQTGNVYANSKQCPGGGVCSNGECPRTGSWCNDPDGLATWSQTTVTSSTTSQTDHCADTRSVLEAYCRGNNVDITRIDCDWGSTCVDGRCVGDESWDEGEGAEGGWL